MAETRTFDVQQSFEQSHAMIVEIAGEFLAEIEEDRRNFQIHKKFFEKAKKQGIDVLDLLGECATNPQNFFSEEQRQKENVRQFIAFAQTLRQSSAENQQKHEAILAEEVHQAELLAEIEVVRAELALFNEEEPLILTECEPQEGETFEERKTRLEALYKEKESKYTAILCTGIKSWLKTSDAGVSFQNHLRGKLNKLSAHDIFTLLHKPEIFFEGTNFSPRHIQNLQDFLLNYEAENAIHYAEILQNIALIILELSIQISCSQVEQLQKQIDEITGSVRTKLEACFKKEEQAQRAESLAESAQEYPIPSLEQLGFPLDLTAPKTEMTENGKRFSALINAFIGEEIFAIPDADEKDFQDIPNRLKAAEEQGDYFIAQKLLEDVQRFNTGFREYTTALLPRNEVITLVTDDVLNNMCDPEWFSRNADQLMALILCFFHSQGNPFIKDKAVYREKFIGAAEYPDNLRKIYLTEKVLEEIVQEEVEKQNPHFRDLVKAFCVFHTQIFCNKLTLSELRDIPELTTLFHIVWDIDKRIQREENFILRAQHVNIAYEAWFQYAEIVNNWLQSDQAKNFRERFALGKNATRTQAEILFRQKIQNIRVGDIFPKKDRQWLASIAMLVRQSTHVPVNASFNSASYLETLASAFDKTTGKFQEEFKVPRPERCSDEEYALAVKNIEEYFCGVFKTRAQIASARLGIKRK